MINYSKLLDGKYAVVTCGDSPVGCAIVQLFAEHGATVAVGAKDARIASKLIPMIGGMSPGSFFWPCDLADAASVEAFCAEVSKRRPLVNVLVNNPWMESDKALEDADDDYDALILQVYQRSIVQTLRAFWLAMLEAGGCSVVNISSSTVFKAVQGSFMHTVANGAVGGMTRVPAVEGGHHEVRVNEILAAFGANRAAPSQAPLNDGLTRAWENAFSAADSRAFGGFRPDVAGIARAALFLASDMASYISGMSLSVSGGAQRTRLA
ncbi:MAG: SDR family oxidoreductase [Oscillospiraceae bacterium]|nr:SDR family oxidoreductase [Oscillospiraceae bacterium]